MISSNTAKSVSGLIPFTQSRQGRRERVQYINALFDIMYNAPLTKNFTISVPSVKVSERIKATLCPLSEEEIAVLKHCGCQCDDWSNVTLMFFGTSEDIDTMDKSSVKAKLKSQIRNCQFSGSVVLGVDEGSQISANQSTSVLLKPGIYSNTMISNTIIEPGAKVYNNSIIANTFIGCGATIVNCGSITYGKEWKDSMTVNLGPESGGGRPVKVIPECTLVDVCSSLSIGQNLDHAPKQDLSKIACTTLSSNIILGEILHTNCASNVYVSHEASIQSSTVNNAILLPHSSIKNSFAECVFLQWKASIINNSTVSQSILMECSEMGPNSVVASTVLGPDSHVSCGEVHCSIIGPNTNSHHQSLLISVLWPTGRGNVGYGSNCGSNHTGRIPDQECVSGEGTFWGLGCVIKFPVDLSRAFYSVVAAGVQLPPQSVAMPFSLIMAGSGDKQTNGMNEIVPGWLLHSSPYTILRSEEKFKNRRKANRHDFYCGWKIIRPSTVDSCRRMRNLLLSVKSWSMTAATGTSGQNSGSTTATTIYTEKDMIQLGKNYMTVRGLNIGIDAYSNLIQRYALEGLLEMFEDGTSVGVVEKSFRDAVSGFTVGNNSDEVSWPVLPWEEESLHIPSKLLEHKLHMLSLEMSSIVDHKDDKSIPFAETCKKCFKKLIQLELHHSKQVFKSKQRDDKRGQQTVPGYIDYHVLAENDPVVLLAQRRTKEVISKCNDLILQLSSEMTSRL